MNPADLALPAVSPSLTNKNLSSSTASSQKGGKVAIPRIDVEPIYTQLKSVLGNQWNDYKAAINAFVLGNLNQAELAWVLQPLLSNAHTVLTASSTSLIPVVQLHNQLVTCLYANICRDPPPSEVAPWVVATDKPSTAKNAGTIGASDKAEERLRREVMALHARDRRRIKSSKPDNVVRQEGGLKDMQDYRYELMINTSDNGAPSASDVTKTSWDMETRRKYVLPLASETLEFPSQSDMHNRIEPICYDEGLITSAQGTLQSCAELMEQAAEAYIKTILGELQLHVRSNGIGCVQTAKFKQQQRKEENEVERGTLQRSSVGLLPVETDVQVKREPLGEFSLHMALELHNPIVVHNRFLSEKTQLNEWPIFNQAPVSWSAIKSINTADSDEMMMDGGVALWSGATLAEQDGLMNVLDDCLAVA